MNANELADLIGLCGDGGYNQDAANMLRQQQAEIEALKMGFANSGTHDSELAETRAMAGRLFLKVQDLEFVQNFAEEQHKRAVALESELDRAVELYTDKAIENEALHRFIDERGETGQLIIWKAQEK